MVTPGFTLDGAKRFSDWFYRTRQNPLEWPDSLKKWFAPQLQLGRSLTQHEVCEWLAFATGLNVSDYTFRVKCIEGWASAPTLEKMKGTVDQWLLCAIARSRFLSINGHRVASEVTLLKVLEGEIDPFDETTVIDDVTLEGARLQGLLFGLRVILGEEEFRDWALRESLWSLSDLAPDGRLSKIMRGEIDVRGDDINAIAQGLTLLGRGVSPEQLSNLIRRGQPLGVSPALNGTH